MKKSFVPSYEFILNVYLTRVATTVVEFFSSVPKFLDIDECQKNIHDCHWTLLVKTQMDPLCAPVYLDLTEMDGAALVKAFRL